MHRSPQSLLSLISIVLGVFACSAFSAEQLSNLNEEKPEKRFEVQDRTWPANPGEAEICLWKDDKIAAVTFTVDDNCSPDVPWWLEMGDKYGIRITWFIITKNVGGNGWGGTWELWKEVLDKGHEVQSHTHTHLHNELPEWESIAWEYTKSKSMIEENLPGTRVRVLAYPGGKNSGLNDREVAAKTYAGARAVTGTLVPVNLIDYMGVRAVTETSFNNPAAKWADLQRILDPADKVFRTWAILIYHGMKDKTMDRPLFVYLQENKESLWFATFSEASLYGQQGDTATLKVTENTASQIAFTLQDRMDDKVFDLPLTVKVRMPASWTTASGQQAGNPVDVMVVEHDGARFALVQAVPDRGPVSISATPQVAAR